MRVGAQSQRYHESLYALCQSHTTEDYNTPWRNNDILTPQNQTQKQLLLRCFKNCIPVLKHYFTSTFLHTPRACVCVHRFSECSFRCFSASHPLKKEPECKSVRLSTRANSNVSLLRHVCTDHSYTTRIRDHRCTGTANTSRWVLQYTKEYFAFFSLQSTPKNSVSQQSLP